MDEGDGIAIKRGGSLEEDTSDIKGDTPKQQLQSSTHQPPISPQHNEPSIQSSIHTNNNTNPLSLQSQVDTTTQSTTHDVHNKIRNESAISTLGFISDRDDYCKGAPHPSRNQIGDEVISEDSGTTINKIKGWFSSSSASYQQNVDDDDDQSCTSNYQNMATPDTEKEILQLIMMMRKL